MDGQCKEVNKVVMEVLFHGEVTPASGYRGKLGRRLLKIVVWLLVSWHGNVVESVEYKTKRLTGFITGSVDDHAWVVNLSGAAKCAPGLFCRSEGRSPDAMSLFLCNNLKGSIAAQPVRLFGPMHLSGRLMFAWHRV